MHFMKAAKPTTKTKSSEIPFIALLAAILAVLFCKSFLPGYVHFSNDGPLGVENAQWLRLPQGFVGCWADLNNIGGTAGSCPPSLTSVTRWILGSVGYAKFFPPLALFILGLGAWTFFRQLRL